MKIIQVSSSSLARFFVNFQTMAFSSNHFTPKKADNQAATMNLTTAERCFFATVAYE
jgi:hypothetical protein